MAIIFFILGGKRDAGICTNCVFAPQQISSWKFAFCARAEIEHVIAIIFQPGGQCMSPRGSSSFGGGGWRFQIYIASQKKINKTKHRATNQKKYMFRSLCKKETLETLKRLRNISIFNLMIGISPVYSLSYYAPATFRCSH